MHIGELLGTIIAKKIGIKACKTELYKMPLSRPGKFDVGVISYVEKSKNDSIYTATSIINEYIKKQEIKGQRTWIHDIDTILDAMFWHITQKKHRPYQEYVDFKQDYINMLVYDLKFTNPDRDEENWMLIENKKTGEIGLYPLFDNASILGFGKNINTNQTFSEDEITKINDEYVVTTITPEDNKKERQDSHYKDMLEYLLKKYPVQTTKALEKVNKFTIVDLKEFLEEVEEMTPERKELTEKLFIKREEEINKIYKKYLENLKRQK